MGNPIKQLAGQTAVYGLSSIVGRLLNYLLVPLYTRIFMTGEYGVVTEMYAYISFLMVLLTYGMETGYFRFASTHKNPKLVFSTAMMSLTVSSVLFMALIWLFSGGIATSLGYPSNPEYVIWLGLIVGLDALTAVPFARLRQENKALRFATMRLINIGINIGLNLFWLVYCPAQDSSSWVQAVYDPSVGVGYVFLSNLFASLATLVMLLPQMTVQWKFDPALWKTLMRYSLPLLVAGLAGMVNETMDRILIKYLAEPSTAMDQLGIYGANYKVAILMTIFIQTFRFAAEPFFFNQAKNKESRVIYARVMHYFVIFCAVIFVGVMLYMDIVKLFIGSEFREGIHVVPILLMANFFLGIFFNLSIWYKLTNQTMYGAWLAVFGAVLTLVLNIILIPMTGYTGAAWATFICYFCMMVVSYILGQKHFQVPYKLGRTGQYLLLAPGLWILSLYLPVIYSPLVLNSVLFAAFLVFVIITERKGLREKLTEV